MRIYCHGNYRFKDEEEAREYAYGQVCRHQKYFASSPSVKRVSEVREKLEISDNGTMKHIFYYTVKYDSEIDRYPHTYTKSYTVKEIGY